MNSFRLLLTVNNSNNIIIVRAAKLVVFLIFASYYIFNALFFSNTKKDLFQNCGTNLKRSFLRRNYKKGLFINFI